METPEAMRWRSVLAIALVMLLAVLVDSQQQCGPGAGGQKCGSGNCCSQYGYCGKDKPHCGSGCQKAYGGCGSCFPATATVIAANGVQKPISQLSIGDKVAVWSDEKGEVEYEDVYAHGHLDAHILSEFIVFTLTSTTNRNATKTLEMSPDHFAFTTTAKNNRDRFKRAKDVRVGDEMLAIYDESHHLSSYIVSDIKREVLRGLYNPYTLRGSIIVNDVLASCHSDWFLDSTFDRLHISPSLLPSAYQTMLAPVRMLYKAIGRDNYQNLYHSLDSRFDIAKSAGDFGGYFKLMVLALSPSSSRDGSRAV